MYNNYIIKKDDKTDMLSSLNKLNKKVLEKVLDKNGCDDINELAEYLIDFTESIIKTCKGDIFTKIFFTELLSNENTSNIVAHDSDIETFVVFLYRNKGKLSYYIPDEIKAIIKKFLSSN